MATDLRVSVKRQIDRLRKNLAALELELEKHEKIYNMLGGGKGGGGRSRASRGPRIRRGGMISWNRVLGDLPQSFTLDTMSKNSSVRGKPRAYLRQVVVRWAKGGKVKRTARGRYQKV